MTTRIEVVSAQWRSMSQRWGGQVAGIANQRKPQLYPAEVLRKGWILATFVVLHHVDVPHAGNQIIVMIPWDQYTDYQDLWLTYELLKYAEKPDVSEQEALDFAEMLFEKDVDADPYYVIDGGGLCLFSRSKLVLDNAGVFNPVNQKHVEAFWNDPHQGQLGCEAEADIVQALHELLQIDVESYLGRKTPKQVTQAIQAECSRDKDRSNGNQSPYRVTQAELDEIARKKKAKQATIQKTQPAGSLVRGFSQLFFGV